MNIKELLPIGSIVRLQNGQKRLMITGVLQSKEDELDKQYDYLGILYPEGRRKRRGRTGGRGLNLTA